MSSGSTSVSPKANENPKQGAGRKLALGAAFLAVLSLGAVVWAESAGWPFLAAPLERQLTRAAQRAVRFDASVSLPEAPATQASGTAGASDQRSTKITANSAPNSAPNTTSAFSIRLFGGFKLRVPAVTVAAPAWSATPHTLQARDLALDLRYSDLWRAYRGGGVRIESLQASSLDAQLERLADGRASWQFGQTAVPKAADRPLVLPTFGVLQIGSGTLSVNDVPLALNIQCDLAWSPPQRAANGLPAAPSVLTVKAKGQYKKLPLVAQLQTAGSVSELIDAKQGSEGRPRLPLQLRATVGRAALSFDGSSASAFSLTSLAGQYDLSGPSLAAVGDPVGVTLPTTGAFRSRGRVVKENANQSDVWRVMVDEAVVGSSRLNGAFSYETVNGVPKLSGHLGGSRLLLADLGPAIGGVPRSEDGGRPVKLAAPALARAPAPAPAPAPAGKVLPARPFDLKALRAMDANVLIDISDVDLNTSLLEPLRPLRVHLQLVSGVLTLSELEARTAQGELRGWVRLDGRNTAALWNANLRWNDVRLERWIKQVRANAAPPWVSGRLNGNAVLQGQGRSTAEILATLKGNLRTELKGGAVSHLAIEAAGLDVAQGLGMLFKGDDALPVQCGVADLVVAAGNFKPRLMVVDTADSAVWVDGSLSLASESMDLRAVVFPKDFSPLALRTPLLVKGSFSKPEVSVEKAPLAKKLGLSVLLGLINPLAALIPLIDVGDAQGAAAGGASGGASGGAANESSGNAKASGCASFAKRARAAAQARRP